MAAQIAHHVDEEPDATGKVYHGSEDGMPEALGPGLGWWYGGCVEPHAYDCCDELGGLGSLRYFLGDTEMEKYGLWQTITASRLQILGAR